MQLVKQAGVRQFELTKNDHLLDLQQSFDKILISPGPGIASETGQLMEYLKPNYESSSVLGICLGQEAIVELFGGKHKKLTHPLHGYRNKATIIKQHYIFKNLPIVFNIGHYHSWYVDKVSFPKQLDVLAKDELGLIMGVTHKKHDVTGLLYHPESYMTDYGKEIIFNWLHY